MYLPSAVCYYALIWRLSWYKDIYVVSPNIDSHFEADMR